MNLDSWVTQMNTTQAYIAVEGVIGVGKTTLARMFQKEIGAQLVLEVFEENPFLTDFYTDRARYAFQTQIFFLLSRYHQQRQLAMIPRPLISDYMFDKDRLFAQVSQVFELLFVGDGALLSHGSTSLFGCRRSSFPAVAEAPCPAADRLLQEACRQVSVENRCRHHYGQPGGQRSDAAVIREVEQRCGVEGDHHVA